MKPTKNNQTPPQQHWTKKANCQNQPHKMFPKTHKDLTYVVEARRLCRTCPVQNECLTYALQFPLTDLHGVWGGLTPRQLAVEAQRRGVQAERGSLSEVWSGLGL